MAVGNGSPITLAIDVIPEHLLCAQILGDSPRSIMPRARPSAKRGLAVGQRN
jgi:hypothetical protein